MDNPFESLQDNEYLVNPQTITSHHSPQTTQDTTESLQDTLTNQPTTSTITDSNALQVPIHNIADNPNNVFHSQDTSILSTTNTTITQPSQTHHIVQRNYDPPYPPSHNSTHSTTHASPQHGSSNTFQTRNQTLTTSQFQMATPPQQSTQPIQYIPA